MLLLTSGLNDCCWSFVLRVDALSIVFVSLVMFACCKLFFCHDTIENVAGTGIKLCAFFSGRSVYTSSTAGCKQVI